LKRATATGAKVRTRRRHPLRAGFQKLCELPTVAGDTREEPLARQGEWDHDFVALASARALGEAVALRAHRPDAQFDDLRRL
jgi:hypothetical protein